MPDRRRVPAVPDEFRAWVPDGEGRGTWTRVNDPLANGLRVNSPDGWPSAAGGWAYAGPLSGDDPRDEAQPVAWVGSDGYGWVGPGSWAGLPHGFEGMAGPFAAGAALPAVDRATGVITNPIIRTDWEHVRARAGVVEDLPIPLWVMDPMLTGSVPGPRPAAADTAGPGGDAYADWWDVDGMHLPDREVPLRLFANTPVMHRLAATDFWTTFLTHAMWYGRGIVVFQEGENGQPLPGTLRLVNPFLVGWERGVWYFGDGDGGRLEVPDDGVFTIDGPQGPQRMRMLVMRGVAPNDGVLPEGILLRHWETLRIGVQIRTYLRDSYRFGNQPSGFLKVSTPNMTQDEAHRLRDAWMRAHGSSRRSVAVLNATVDYSPINTVAPVDAAVGDVMRANLVDVAHCFNLDPIWLGVGASGMNYNNQTDRRSDVVDFTISMWGQKLMDALSNVLPYGSRLKIDWRSFVVPLTPDSPQTDSNPSSADPEG